MITTLKNIVDFYAAYPEKIGHLNVSTRNGPKIIEYADVTAIDSDIIRVQTSSGKTIETSPDHLLWRNVWVKTRDLCLGDFIDTIDGKEEIVSLSKLNLIEDLYDLQVDGYEFYANGIVSHNSTFLDAVTFVLFNKPFRKINKPQLINNINKGDTEVVITFTANGGNEYRVVRGLKPNIFEIYENGVLINQDANSRDYQEYLETNILKMNYKAFTQIVVIGHATYMPFMKLSPNDRRVIVENLLDIDIFSKMNQILKQDITEIKEAITDVSYKYDITKEKMKLYENNLQTSKTNIENKIVENNSEISGLKIKIQVKQTNLDAKTKEISQIHEDEKTLASLKGKLSKLSSYELAFGNKLKNTEKEIKFFTDNNNCSLCHQDIEIRFKDHILANKIGEIGKIKQDIVSTREKINYVDKKIDELNDRLKVTNKTSNEISSISMEINLLTKEVDKIQKQNLLLLEEKSDDLKSIELEYENTKALISEHIRVRDELLKTQHINSLAGVLLRDDGIKTKIIKYYLPTMNKLINKYLGMMDFFVNFNLDENFEEIIKIANRENFSYNSFSEGEKLRIDLAILFTWREISKLKNSANTNLLVLDEVFDSSLDNTGIDDFLRIINSFNDANSNIFIISHKDEILTDRFDNTIKFEKVNGFSKIAAN